MNKKNFTVLDLKLNKPSDKILQVGVVIGNIYTKNIVCANSLFVKTNEKISEYVTKVSGITQENVKNGIDLLTIYNKISSLHSKHNSSSLILSWGRNNSEYLKSQLKKEYPNINIENNWKLGYRCIDVKTIYQFYQIINGKELQGGILKAVSELGLKFIGKKHDALWDSFNIFKIFVTLMEKMKYNNEL